MGVFSQHYLTGDLFGKLTGLKSRKLKICVPFCSKTALTTTSPQFPLYAIWPFSTTSIGSRSIASIILAQKAFEYWHFEHFRKRKWRKPWFSTRSSPPFHDVIRSRQAGINTRSLSNLNTIKALLCNSTICIYYKLYDYKISDCLTLNYFIVTLNMHYKKERKSKFLLHLFCRVSIIMLNVVGQFILNKQLVIETSIEALSTLNRLGKAA